MREYLNSSDGPLTKKMKRIMALHKNINLNMTIIRSWIPDSEVQNKIQKIILHGNFIN